MPWLPLKSYRRDPVQLSDALAKVSSRMGAANPTQSFEIFTMWPDIAGQAVADNAFPINLRDGVLTIEAKSVQWAVQLEFLHEQLMARMREKLGPLAPSELLITNAQANAAKRARSVQNSASRKPENKAKKTRKTTYR